MEVETLKENLRHVEFDEEHDEDAVIGQLVELYATHLVVCQQNASNYAQNLNTHEIYTYINHG